MFWRRREGTRRWLVGYYNRETGRVNVLMGVDSGKGNRISYYWYGMLGLDSGRGHGNVFVSASWMDAHVLREQGFYVLLRRDNYICAER